MDLAELGIVFLAEGADAAIAKMAEFKDATVSATESDEDRLKAQAKLVVSQENLSNQINRSIVSYKNSQAAQYEFAAIVMGSNDVLEKQISILKELEARETLAKEISKEWAQEYRNEQGYLQDLAKDIEHLNKVRAQEAAEAEKARQTELASRQKYYDDIVAKAKAAEQAITDARHKAILDAQNATNAAAAMYIKEEQERVKAAEKANQQITIANQRAADIALRNAEQQAMSEISWAAKSRDEQLRIKDQIATHRAAGISEPTIQNMFGAGAVNGTVKEVSNLAEKWDQVSLNTSRARSEMIVLAHEALQGRFSRIPASMMVFAEYTDVTALALSGLGLSIMAVAAAGVGLSYFMIKGMIEQREMADALIMTGNYAGITADALNELGHAAVRSGGSLADAKDLVTKLAASGKYTAEEIGTVSTAIMGIEHATGMGEKGVDNLVKQFESLKVQANAHSRYSDEISKAIVKLSGEHHFLTAEILDQITALEQEGKKKEASKLATDEFAKALRDRTEEMVNNLGRIERGWNAIKEAIGHAKDGLMDWGKKDTAQTEYDSAIAQLNTYAKGKNVMVSGSWDYEAYQKQLLVVADAQQKLADVNQKAFEKGEAARKQDEAVLGLQRLNAEATKTRADKMGEYQKKVLEISENLAKVEADPRTSPMVKVEAEKKAAEQILYYRDKYKEKKTPKQHLSNDTRLGEEIENFKKAAEDVLANDGPQTASQKFQTTELTKMVNAYNLGTISLKEFLALEEKLQVALNKKTDADQLIENKKILAKVDAEQAKQSKAQSDEFVKQFENGLKVANAYREAEASAKSLIETANNKARATLSGVGIGSSARSDNAALLAVEERYQREKAALIKVFDQDGNSAYQARLVLAKDTYEKELAIVKKSLEDKKKVDADWRNGAKESYANYMSNIQDVAKMTQGAFDRAFKGMEDALVKFVKTGELNFNDLADSIISDMIRIGVQRNLMPMMSGAMMGGASWIASLFAANGHSFDSSGVVGFANGAGFHNSVLNQATPFAFASGGGFSQAVAGEAGPEAVMPLTRGANGKLGVQSTGGNSAGVVVNIIESPGNGGKQNRRTENQTSILDVYVEKIKNDIASDISKGSGAVPAAMSQTYGLNRVAGVY